MSSSPSRSGGGPGPALSALIAEGLRVHPDEISRMYGDASSDDNSSDDTDDMPPLEDIIGPVGTARRSEGEVEEIEAFGIRVLAPAPTRPSRPTAAAASGSAAARAKPADARSDDSSVVEIVDLPDVSSPRDHNMARRTRSHNDASSPSPARRRKPPAANATGGLKTTGLDSEDNLTPTRKKAGKKRSADDNDDVERGDQKKEATVEQHCSICLEPPARDEETRLNNCEHIFCFSCIETWAERENTCPLCKVRFTKIERVNKPPPSKRRKKGGSKGSGGKNAKKATKRIKSRDQREDLLSANPLAGLFEHLEASGTMPRSIAQLIFGGLGGPNPFANMPNRTINVSARRRGAPASSSSSSSRTEASGDYIIARDPTTGRFTRVPRERAASSSSSSPPAAASASAARASSSRRSTRSASSSAATAASSSGNGRPAFGSGAPPNVSVTLNSYGPTSLNLPGSPPPGFFSHSGRYPRGLGSLLFHDSDDEDDDDFVPSQYETFVRRARSRSSPLRVSRREVPMPPTQPHLPPANTADTAIEIGDSDDDGGDDEVVVLDE